MNSTATRDCTPVKRDPLTWEEARARLREILEDYIENPPDTTTTTGSLTNHHRDPTDAHTSVWERWFDHDMDVYAGSLLASLAFLVVSSLSLTSIEGDSSVRKPFLGASASVHMYRAQVSAASTLMMGCLISALLMGRRRNTSVKDSGSFKRRAIYKYLAGLDKKPLHDCINSSSGRAQDTSSSTRKPLEGPSQTADIQLAGTSLTGIFPVYRTTTATISSAASNDWVNIPALLLVEGDYVALQIGDVAPANCRCLETGTTLVEGERIVKFTTKDFVAPPLPPGRTTVPSSNSSSLLALCNMMNIFVVEQAPMTGFLHRPPPSYRSPQVHRQLMDIRKVTYLFSIGAFLTSMVLIFVRPNIASYDLSVLIYAPLLAAMGGLPIISPIFLMLLEVLGTARILAAAHPFATRKIRDKNEDSLTNTLLLRYILATISSRLSLHEFARKVKQLVGSRWEHQSDLIPIPAASMCLLEKLGVATAFTLVDDELACETNSTPQQLLIPSSNGLKLLDICPTMDEYERVDESDDSDQNTADKRKGGAASSQESESEDSDDDAPHHQASTTIAAPIRQLQRLRRRVQKRISSVGREDGGGDGILIMSQSFDKNNAAGLYKSQVQFEDPQWWQHLPSLKCIGLGCLLVDRDGTLLEDKDSANEAKTIAEKLVNHITDVERRRKQFELLASCIGFKTEENSFGKKGDITPFDEVSRFQVISAKSFQERLETDSHALGLEDSRNWGKLRTDSTSVIVQDRRSKAYQLLTVGDPIVVTALCQEAWQGENSTILPLSASDRESILNTSNDWTLADLDVAAFSYTPLPHTFETSFDRGQRGSAKKYLLDNAGKDVVRETESLEWSMIERQIFLGVLGSSVIPRKEISKVLEIFAEAGVRFVYFSPRNMRRTKEVASQMGIDVAWNCAISLRPLDAGEDDQYRMVSNYADWDVNAKLPHGIEDVRKHLEEVDNVPLLVSLFTDVTKESTAEMVETFQEYSDTVLAMGISHFARNASIFDTADLSVGVDILFDSDGCIGHNHFSETSLRPAEVELVTSISTSSCVFRLRGPSSAVNVPQIIASSRAAFQAASSAIAFVSTGCTAFSLFIVFSMCSVSPSLPIIPPLGSILYLLLMLPIAGLAMAMSEEDPESMKQVPPKNPKTLVFGKNERFRVYVSGLLKSLVPAVLPQLLWLIAFGELMVKFEPGFVRDRCDGAKSWVSLIQCVEVQEYSGPVRRSAGALVFADMVICMLCSSASFHHSTRSVWEEAPWRRNRLWIKAMILNSALLAGYLVATLIRGCMSALPWYFFLIAVLAPALSLIVDEAIKILNRKHIKRAVMMRRLQFETRLGMWSPK